MSATMFLGLLCLFPIAQHILQLSNQIKQISNTGFIKEKTEVHWFFSLIYFVVLIWMLFTSYWWTTIVIILFQYVLIFIVAIIIMLLTNSKALTAISGISINFLSMFGYLYVLLNEWHFKLDWSPLMLF